MAGHTTTTTTTTYQDLDVDEPVYMCFAAVRVSQHDQINRPSYLHVPTSEGPVSYPDVEEGDDGYTRVVREVAAEEPTHDVESANNSQETDLYSKATGDRTNIPPAKPPRSKPPEKGAESICRKRPVAIPRKTKSVTMETRRISRCRMRDEYVELKHELLQELSLLRLDLNQNNPSPTQGEQEDMYSSTTDNTKLQKQEEREDSKVCSQYGDDISRATLSGDVKELLAEQQFSQQIQHMLQQMNEDLQKEHQTHEQKVSSLQQQLQAIRIIRQKSTKGYPRVDRVNSKLIEDELYHTVKQVEDESEDDDDYTTLPQMTSEQSANSQVLATVLFDYQTCQPDELSIKYGDMVTVLDMPEGGWWVGRCEDRYGIFPANYVELLYDNLDAKLTTLRVH